jgi:RES domain-containing protein
MPGKDPPEVIELFERIGELLPKAIQFEGTVVRSAGTRYANEKDFLSGEGAAYFGGRWNRRGIRAVYASLDIITATHEAYQNFLSHGFSLSAIRPRVTAGASIKLTAVFDVSARAVRRKIGFALMELLEEDWAAIQAAGDESWTQAIGRGCYENGFEALLVPSARNRNGKNLVIFPDRLRPASTLELLGPDDLPPHPATWPP